MAVWSLVQWGLDNHTYTVAQQMRAQGVGLLFTLITLLGAVSFHHHAVWHQGIQHVLQITSGFLISPQQALWAISAIIALLISLHGYRYHHQSGNIHVVCAHRGLAIGVIISVTGLGLDLLKHAALSINNPSAHQPMALFLQQLWPLMVYQCIVWGLSSTYRHYYQRVQMHVQRHGDATSQTVGKACIATEQDYQHYGLRCDHGGLLGKDTGGLLRYPTLTDRLVVAYRGGGKTAGLLIPGILDYRAVNKFIIDIKGELAAVTAEQAQQAGRTVYCIDPFHVLNSLQINLTTHSINPLAGLNTTTGIARDRMLAALAATLCHNGTQSHGETEIHFRDNAQIIIEGIMDFYTTASNTAGATPTLVGLHDAWLNWMQQDSKSLLEGLRQGSHKAQAAAAQLSVAGMDEAGSMKTTVYRQLQWLRSDAIRACFRKDTVDLQQFITGQCDIYVVLPEDMVAPYGQVVRVLMALIKATLVQAAPQQLQPDYLLLLDELGQFGYCPDVEQAINTLRARGVKVWTSFQTVGQIEAYQDPAVFKSMPIKHFLGNDDVNTLEWIQTLGGQTTVLSEHIARPHASGVTQHPTPPVNHVSVSETATPLLPMSELREMKHDEQVIFIHGKRPIRCQKAFYFREKLYQGKYADNPLEKRV